ncbi:MAG: hypothetical protein HOY71_53085, partial [Nonomuraea sp.]|nr:hypothetical protein [Nonomuraea sp.]
MDELAATMTGFARTLRAAGVAADHERTQNLLRALDHLDVAEPAQVYWAGRLTLCATPDDLPRYDRCFAAWFGGEKGRQSRTATTIVTRHATAPDGDGDEQGEGDVRHAAASRSEVLRHRDV